jgi:hypothetical protein
MEQFWNSGRPRTARTDVNQTTRIREIIANGDTSTDNQKCVR